MKFYAFGSSAQKPFKKYKNLQITHIPEVLPWTVTMIAALSQDLQTGRIF